MHRTVDLAFGKVGRHPPEHGGNVEDIRQASDRRGRRSAGVGIRLGNSKPTALELVTTRVPTRASLVLSLGIGRPLGTCLPSSPASLVRSCLHSCSCRGWRDKSTLSCQPPTTCLFRRQRRSTSTRSATVCRNPPALCKQEVTALGRSGAAGRACRVIVSAGVYASECGHQGNEQGLRTVLARVARSPGNPLISPAWLQPWAGSCPPSRAWRLARHLDHPALINSPAMTSTITAISTFVPAFPTSLAISSPRKYEIPT
jgi:hypothetical protein